MRVLGSIKIAEAEMGYRTSLRLSVLFGLTGPPPLAGRSAGASVALGSIVI